MCLGVPMRVLECDGLTAICERPAQAEAGGASSGERRRVSVALLGPQPSGTWLLVHIETAVATLEPEEADEIGRALQGLDAALRGEDADGFFADLVDREPELPAHLRPPEDS